MKCQICNAEVEQLTPMLFSRGSYFVCFECLICWLVQFIEFDNKSIEEYLDFLEDDLIKKGVKK